MPDEPKDAPSDPSPPAPAPLAPAPPAPADDVVTTRHSLALDGDETLSYTASAGRLVLREEVVEEGVFKGNKAKAEVFVVSYVADVEGGSRRPVTFAFNGGPGSSSVWLHLGLLGPRKVVMGDAGQLLPPPYGLADNHETLLRHSDLVFIDPVSTGYSRVAEGDKAADFHGYQRDLETVGEVIRLWTSRHKRWMSPKYLIGESYGTLRAAALADHLGARHGMALNGVMLVSAVLDMGTLRDEPPDGNDIAFVLSLPSFACIAHYHGRLGSRPVAEVRADAEQFALGDYARALLLGGRMTAEERESALEKLAALTGLEQGWLGRANMRIESQRFFRELLRDAGLTVGRLDGRFTSWEADAVGERIEVDPSYSAIHGPYAAACNHYLRGELEYQNDLPYEILTDRVHPWSYKEFEGKSVSVAERLAAAMRVNPHLRVQVAAGYYDGATPYFAAEHTMHHLNVPDELRGNVTFNYYEAGHMMYVHEESRLALSGHLAEFVTPTNQEG
jgi:carboxypeptidase C (cathepsin A)